jgi:hypothetical protein
MKVALVHDWLTGMRGGEKCLEVFCEIFPQADLYTLIYDPDGVSPIIKQLNVTASWIDRLPRAKKHFRYLLPVVSAGHRKFRFRCVRSGSFEQPLRRQGDTPASRASCYLRACTDALRLGPAQCVLRCRSTVAIAGGDGTVPPFSSNNGIFAPRGA